MNASPGDDAFADRRREIYAIVIAIACGGIVGRILAVNAVDQIRLEAYLRGQGRENVQLQRPFLSANDRSRWATVRALVEHGTYAIDEIVSQPNWDTIDMVQHPDRDGVPRLYSSKPPLLATLLAGEYWIVYQCLGLSLGEHPFLVGRLLLILNNVPAIAVLLIAIASVAEQLGTTDWGRLCAVATAAFGTFLTTFAVVLNNHLFAAASTAIVLACLVRIVWGGERQWGVFALAGFFAAFAAANELPALSLFALATAIFFMLNPRMTLLAYLPAAMVVVAAYFGTNYLAHASFRPPYAHRGDGPELFRLSADDESIAQLRDDLREQFSRAGAPLSRAATSEVREDGRTWTIEDPENRTKYAVVRVDGAVSVRAWDNWYDYRYVRDGRVRESYWRNRQGRSKIDQGESSLARYALHVLVGHHGIFSLTPIWLLAPLGLAAWMLSWNGRRAALAAGILFLSVVCVGFYLARPPEDRNYGGMTSGFRWAFWLIPLWLAAIQPACDALCRFRPGRAVVLVLLAFSVMSASYPTWNPWTHPWFLVLLKSLGLLDL